ncbi:MAG: CreA family protein, partial [Pseudomonas putida]|nr:CreA family protein [Pseudomonas putida]
MSLFKRVIAVVALALPMLAGAEEVGQVSTVFKFLGPNDRIVVEAFDDPKVEGVTC